MPALKVDKSFVLDKCRVFMELQLWPISKTINPSGWLNNFKTPEDLNHACHLLNAFIFYSESLTDQVFLSAFQSIGNTANFVHLNAKSRAQAWQSFCDEVIVTYVTGESPNPSDSGYLFARKARQWLGIPESRVLHPSQAIISLLRNTHLPVLFVDDFVGSGNQFVSTWRRPYNIGPGMTASFEALAKSGYGNGFYYNPVVCTALGRKTIEFHCPQIGIVAGNHLTERYNALHPDSYVWPEELKISGPSFIADVSSRLGIPDIDGQEGDWRGFNKLGLCMAFSHSTPDATLPMFYWEHGDWTPMVRRR